jgi:hypothetical protein
MDALTHTDVVVGRASAPDLPASRLRVTDRGYSLHELLGLGDWGYQFNQASDGLRFINGYRIRFGKSEAEWFNDRPWAEMCSFASSW